MTERGLPLQTSVGIDVGGTWIKTVATRGDEIVDRTRQRRTSSLSSFLPPLVAEATNEYGTGNVGIGIAGLVDQVRSRFIWGPHLDDGEVDILGLLHGSVDALAVDNDANFAAFGEWRTGAARGHDVALTVSVGTGIGAGIVAGGSLWRGAGLAGEVGHMRIGPGNSPCHCGKSGCWETLVSGRQLASVASQLGLSPYGESLVAAAHAGSEIATEALLTAGGWLGVGLLNLILVLDPSVVVIAGGLSAAGPLILDAARDRIASGMPGYDHRPRAEVVEAHHGPWAAAVGAALFVQQAGQPSQVRQERNETE